MRCNMEFKRSSHEDIEVVKLSGKILMGSGDVAMKNVINELISEGKTKIILDLQHAKVMDSTGMGEMVSSYSRFADTGGQMKICNVPARILELLQVTSLVDVLPIVQSLEEALESLK